MYRLVLLRHGESTWNKENRFTGWTDVDLERSRSGRGGRSRTSAEGRAIRVRRRAHITAQTRHPHAVDRALRAGHDVDPECRSWRLNERHYGGLQGLNKAETAAKHGEAQVKIWRRSYDIPPPPLTLDDPQHPSRDRRYADLKPNELPLTESLKDTVARFLPYWHSSIAPDIRAGKRVLIAAHGNSLRALVKYLDHTSEQDIVELNIPTGDTARVRARRATATREEVLPGGSGGGDAKGSRGGEPGTDTVTNSRQPVPSAVSMNPQLAVVDRFLRRFFAADPQRPQEPAVVGCQVETIPGRQ